VPCEEKYLKDLIERAEPELSGKYVDDALIQYYIFMKFSLNVLNTHTRPIQQAFSETVGVNLLHCLQTSNANVEHFVYMHACFSALSAGFDTHTQTHDDG